MPAKYYLLKRPEPRFDGRMTTVIDKETRRVVDTIPDLTQGVYRSAWATYELALQSVTRGADILTVLQLRKKLQDAADPEDANYDSKFLVVTDAEHKLIIDAVRNFDWTFSSDKGSLGSSFFVTWTELFETVLDPDSANYGFSDYDISRPSDAYVADASAFDARKSLVAERFRQAKERYAASKTNQDAPFADAVEPTEPALLDVSGSIGDGELAAV